MTASFSLPMSASSGAPSAAIWSTFPGEAWAYIASWSEWV